MNEQSFEKKLHHVINTIQKYYVKDVLSIDKIRQAFSLTEKHFKAKKEDHMILHAISVAERLAKWRMDYSTVIAGLLHDVVKTTSSESSQVSDFFSSLINNELENYLYLCAELKNNPDNPEIFPETTLVPCYILAAERLDHLLSCRNNPSDSDSDMAKQTCKVLIPKMKQYHAFKIVNELEEACFRIICKKQYEEMHRIVESFYDQSQSYTDEFFHALNRLFKSADNTENSKLSQYHPHISRMYRGKRSYVSLYRFSTRFSKSKQEQHALLNNTYITAFWDITLVVDDNLDIHNSLNKEELFFAYYQENLRKKGIQFLGYHDTSYRDSTYFLISDEFKNIYRFFIKTESEHLRYLCGDIIDSRFFIAEDPTISQPQKILVYCRNGRPLYFNPGSTVLDFAFAIHKDIGLCFSYAIINENESKKYGCHYLLNDGDKIEIFQTKKPNARLSWFRHVNTDTAKDALIKYFNSNFSQNSSKQ